MPYTLVVFHAHPDDEALLTSGTMARASAEGHRVVLVVATAGGVGLVSSDFLGEGESLAARRLAELRRSATALGCSRTEVLGYADSGLDGLAAGEGAVPAFASADVDAAAERLAELLREERADVLTVYDPAGGYGHPDHVQVHHVGLRAADLAGTPVVLEATVDRDLITRALRLVQKVYRFPAEFDPTTFDRAYTPRAQLTHKVDVRRYAVRKRTSMAAHASQATADGADRTLAAFLRMPMPVFRRVFGQEWYVERGRRPGGPLLDDIFATLRGTER
ncbi:MAG TPA: PIG-L family deacetylase [Actinomycetes bacterium]